jgi:hypothetical protein
MDQYPAELLYLLNTDTSLSSLQLVILSPFSLIARFGCAPPSSVIVDVANIVALYVKMSKIRAWTQYFVTEINLASD